MRNLARWLLPLLLLGAACSGRAPVPVAAPPAAQTAAKPGLSVLLIWSAPVDLDLYLTDPTSETVYFANNPSRSGARLIRDTRCNDAQHGDTAFMEEAYVSAPRAGRYRVGVDFIDRCGAAAAPVSYRIVADLHGARREMTGLSTPQVFQAIALEFDLYQDRPDAPLVFAPAQRSEEG